MRPEENPLKNEPEHLREQVARLRAENARLLTELEQLTPDLGARLAPGPAEAGPTPEPLPIECAQAPAEVEGVVAATGNPMILGVQNQANQTTELAASGEKVGAFTGTGDRWGVAGHGVGPATPEDQAAPGVWGWSNSGNGVQGEAYTTAALNGVQGVSYNTAASGVYGENRSGAGYGTAGRGDYIGVWGESTGQGGAGVVGSSEGGVGVFASSQDEDGLTARSTNGVGVRALSANSDALLASSKDQSAIKATSVNSYGVRGFSANSVGVLATTNSSSGAGLLAENGSESPSGVAAIALGQIGVGLYASGQHAAVQLGRAWFTGAPTTGFHNAGELVLDDSADLWLCKVTGTPGTWTLLG